MPELLLAKKCCGQCLTTKGRIVSGARAAEIIKGCRSSGTHFVCHKSNDKNPNVHCRGVHNRFPSQSYRLALLIGIPIKEVDTDRLAINELSR